VTLWLWEVIFTGYGWFKVVSILVLLEGAALLWMGLRLFDVGGLFVTFTMV